MNRGRSGLLSARRARTLCALCVVSCVTGIPVSAVPRVPAVSTPIAWSDCGKCAAPACGEREGKGAMQQTGEGTTLTNVPRLTRRRRDDAHGQQRGAQARSGQPSAEASTLTRRPVSHRRPHVQVKTGANFSLSLDCTCDEQITAGTFVTEVYLAGVPVLAQPLFPR
jgi:hypothetical protein